MWAKLTVVVLLALCGAAIAEEEEKKEFSCGKFKVQPACENHDNCEWSGEGECVEGDAAPRTLNHFSSHIPNHGAPPPNHAQSQPHIDGNTCRMFPYTCRPDKYDIKTLNAPVNIPYCQRIPCPVVDQQLRAKTQLSMRICMEQPGCFFDRELYYNRLIWGNSILPDVPVCHLVIRNQVFLEHARKYTAQYNGWNPLLTKCLMETYHDEIYGDTPGCYMASILDYFGYRPRVAGWKGISPQECHTIDGCWLVNSKGCAYPVEGQEAEFRPFPAKQAPEQPRTISTDPYEVYNRVACHRFNNLHKADEFLDTYHQCMASGCVLDPYIQNYYHSHFRNMTVTLPPHLQTIFYKKVMTNEIRADNFRQQIYHLQTMYSDKRPASTPFYNPFMGFTPYNSYHYSGSSATPYTLPGDYGLGSQHTGNSGYQQQGYGYGGYQQQNYGYGYQNYGYQIRCPYEEAYYKTKSVKPLLGSFKGCCERSLCYAPAGNVHTSVLSSYYSMWSQWSQCPVSCGGGNQTRSRACIGQMNRHCDAATETQACNEQECPVWQEWAAYSECSVTCGTGIQTRSRTCTVGQCMGPSVQSIHCQASEQCQSTYAPPPVNPYQYGQNPYQYTQGGSQYPAGQGSLYPSGQQGAYPNPGGYPYPRY